MSKEKKNTQNEKRKLSRQERKQIDTLIRQAKGDGKPNTAQDSIPFERMYKDGICRLANGRYSKCIEFEDINYQLAQPDDKTAIFEALCDMYNSFDASISVQLSLISRHANKDDFKNSITIAPQNDDFDSIRAEYTEMLRTQLERGNNGLIKTKFLTFTVEAKDIRSARARLARIETDTLNHFKVIGAAARVLDGKQRLEVLHGIFHPDGERFNFAWEWLPASGLSVKDFIAPSSFRFGDGRMFQMGGKFGAVSFLQIVAPELSDRMLADFMDAENGIIVNLHIQSIDHNEAIKTIKRKITDLDRMKIEEQKKAIRSGYDMDIIPSDLATYGGEAKNLLRDLQSRNERMFLLTLLVLNLADTKQKLDNEVFGAAAIAQKYNCILTRLDYRQEQGLMSSIPLGDNLIHIQRGLTTSSTAVFVPFTVQELFQSGEALYYGLNALSNNMILCDRKKLKNPNGLILGTQLKKVGMLIVQDQVWNRVTVNRSEGKATRYYIDEFHLLLKEEQTAAYSVEIWKRFRKWGGIPTGITQNVKDLLSSREVENIFENSDFVYMLNQAQGDREILAKQLNISQQQMTYVTHSEAGEGLIFYGNVILPFIDRFPKDTELYRVMTTKPGEVSA